MECPLVSRLHLLAPRVFGARDMLAVYAYGSRISGSPRPGSDLDVGYYLRGFRTGRTLTLAEEMQIAAELSEALGVEVDLRNLADAPLELRGRVLEEGVRVHSGDDVERVGLERDLLGRYHDYKEVFRRMHEIRLKGRAERGLG